jgi:hypothetical protein
MRTMPESMVPACPDCASMRLFLVLCLAAAYTGEEVETASCFAAVGFCSDEPAVRVSALNGRGTQGGDSVV